QKASYLLHLLDEQAVRRAEQARAEGRTDAADALERDVLFAVRQRRQDVATQIAVTVQAYMAMGLIEDNNTQLAQGVERAQTTTATARRPAAIAAPTLDNEKPAVGRTAASNRTTAPRIDRTSHTLAHHTQPIQEPASISGDSPEALPRAFDHLFT